MSCLLHGKIDSPHMPVALPVGCLPTCLRPGCDWTHNKRQPIIYLLCANFHAWCTIAHPHRAKLRALSTKLTIMVAMQCLQYS